jgi:hypothetical protein
MRITPRRGSAKSPSAKPPRRSHRPFLEELEDRTLLSVTSSLSNGILDIAFSADNDAATVSALGTNLQVQSGGTTNTFPSSSISSINAHNTGGQNQSIAIKGGLTLTGELDVTGLANVTISGANYGASAVKVTGAGTIGVQTSTLTTAGDQTFAAAVTASGSSGTLSTSGTGTAQVTVTDSTLGGSNLTLTAADTLTVSAQQSGQQGSSAQDFQNAQGTSTAQVIVTGASSLRATGSVLVQATTTDSTIATARAAPSGTSSSLDAAIALARVTSTALAKVGGRTSVSAGGTFQLLAANTTTLTASADGSAGGSAAKGGTFADAELTGNTTATVADTATVTAASVVISATSNNTVSSSAKSAQGGATQNSATTQQALQNNSSATGGIGLAGAFALTGLNTRQTEASITSTGAVTATGTVQVTAASATNSSATADASTTTGTTDASGNTFGLGVAVAIDKGSAGNRADISGNANVRGGTVTVAAQLPVSGRTGQIPNAFSAQATSGAGAKNVGIAGAFALNAVNDTAEAVVPAGSAVTTAGNFQLTAQNTVTNTATAQPGQNVAAGKLGVGASFAYNVPNNLTRAEIENGASVRGATNLTLSANANDTTTTTAKGGAGSQVSLGNAAVTPVMAVAEATNQTTARVGSSAATPTQLSGALQVTATHTAATTTSAEGNTDATKVGFGVSVAVTEAADTASATAAFAQAGGAVTLKSSAAANSSTSAKASVIGGETNPDKNADGKVKDQKNKADSLSGKTGANPTSAQTADGLISVAGAIASNVATPAARAGVEDSGSVQAGGLLTITASQNSDASSTGDGSQTGQSGSGGSAQFGIGVGIALNTVNSDTGATVGQNAAVTAHGLTLQTSMLSVSGDATSTFTSTANSGAGATKLGFAGALARNAITDTSEAEIKPGAQVNAGTGGASDDVTLSAASTTSNNATAKSQTPGQAKFGVGPSVALAFGTNTIQASLDASAGLAGANDLTLSATGNHTFKSTTDAGTQSTGDDSTSVQGTIGFTPSVAVSGDANTTTALVAAGPQITLTGNLTESTSHTSSADSEASASAAGTSAAIGTAFGLNFLSDTSSVTLARDATVTGNASLTSASTTSALAKGNASANGGSNEQAPTLTDRLKNFVQGAIKPGTTSPSLGDRFNSGVNKAIGKAQGVGASGQGLGVAAALAGNSAADQTTAAVADGVHLTATGTVTVSTAANNDASAQAFGQAIGTSSRTSLAGAGAFNAVDVTNSASVGNATVQANGITVTADLPAGEHDDFKVLALGGAGSNQTTFAGSVGVNDITDTTSATAAPNAVLNSSGALTVSAHGDVRLENTAGSATGSKNSGVGIAVAVNTVTDTTDAALGTGAKADAAGALTVAAQASLAPVTGDIPGDPLAVAVGGDVQGGNGLAGSLTVNDLHETTHAHIDNGAQVNTRSAVSSTGGRGVEVHAADQTTLTDLAGALNLSKSLGVGIGLDVGDLTKDTQAFIARSATVQADKDINVHAESTESATSIAAAFSGSFSAGLAGAISFYEPSTKTAASIGNDPTILPGGTPTGAGATTLSGGNTFVAASHSAGITTFTGGVGATFGNTSVGAAFARVATQDTVDAAVSPDARVTARGSTGLAVTASNSENVTPLALGGTGSGGTGLAGSMLLNSLGETTAAHIDHGAVIDATSTAAGVNPSVAVNATDSTTLTGVAGAVVFGGFAGVGAGIDSESITKTTQAYIASGTTVNATQDIKVQAASTEKLVSISGAGSVGGSAAIMGAVGVVNLNATTRAELGADPNTPAADPATAHASGNVVVTADDNDVLNVLAGSLGVSAGLSLGGSAAVPVVTKDVEAFIAGAATVTADAAAGRPGAVVNTGLFNVQFQPFGSGFGLPSQVRPPAVSPVDNSGTGQNDESNPSFTGIHVATPLTTAAQGVAISATSRDDVDALGLAGGAAFGAAVNLGLPVSVINDTTHAFIDDGAKVNVDRSHAGANQSVLVTAASDVHHLGVAVGAAVAGGFAGGPAAEIAVIHGDTVARVGQGAQVFATLDVGVSARATEDVLGVSAGVAVAGGVGIAGSVAVLSLNSLTRAIIDQNARVSAGRTVRLTADDETDADEVSGSIGLGLAGGAGASVNVLSIHKDTEAFVAAGAVVDGTANGPAVLIFPPPPQGVLLQATSGENVHNVAAAAGGSFGLSAAGGVAVTVIDSTTAAHVDAGTQVNANSTGAAASQAVRITAEDAVTSFSVGGGLAGGAGALAGGVDVGVIHSNTAAFVAGGATVKARGDINIDAASTEDVTSFGLSGAGGLVGLNGSVSVWSLGAPFGSSYSDSSGDSANSLSGDNGNVDTFAANEVLNAPSGALTGLGSYRGGTPLAQQAAAAGLQAQQAITGNAPSATSVTSDLHNTPAATVPQGTSAFIAAGATVSAGGDLDLEATDNLTANQTVGGVSLSAFLSIGASVGVLNVRSQTDAHVAGTAGAGGDLTVHARLDETTQQTSIAGQGSIFGALGAAVVVVNDTSSQNAALTGSVPQTGGLLTVSAQRFATLGQTTGEAAVGAVAAGAAIAEVNVKGPPSRFVGVTQPTTRAAVTGAQVGQSAGQTVGTLAVNAFSQITVNAGVTGFSAGLLSGQFNVADAELAPDVEATVTGGAVTLSSDLDVNATSTTNVSATTSGVNLISAATGGASLATARVTPDVTAALQDPVITVGRDVNVTARAQGGVGATANASSGSLFGSLGSLAIADVRPNVHADIQTGVEVLGSVTAGRDVSVASKILMSADARAENVTVQLVGAGDADASANNSGDSDAAIDGTVLVTAGDDVTVSGESQQSANAHAQAKGSGGIPTPAATGIAAVSPQTTATVGAGITAGDLITVQAVVHNAAATAQNIVTEGTGVGSGSTSTGTALVGSSLQFSGSAPQATSVVPGTALAQTEIQGFANLQAARVALDAEFENVQAATSATATDGGAGVSPHTSTDAEVATKADVLLDAQSSVTGTTSVDLAALHDGVFSSASSTNNNNGVGLFASCAANNSQVTTSQIDGAAGALVKTRLLTVQANSTLDQFLTVATKNRLFDSVPGDTSSTLTPVRKINWNANVVVLSAPDPELTIDASGNVTHDVNLGISLAEAPGTGNPILPPGPVLALPISNTPTAQPIRFTIDHLASFGNLLPGSIVGGAGTVTYVHNFDHITIRNAAPKDLTLQGINVFSTVQQTVNINVESDGNFNFNIAHQFGPTLIDIQNNGAVTQGINVNGLIENPVGTTSLATSGNIVAGVAGLIHTGALNLQATQGSISGPAAGRLPVQLVQSDVTAAQFSAAAGQDIHLDVSPQLRQVLPAGQAFTISVPVLQAGGSVDLFLRDAVLQTTEPANLPSAFFSKVIDLTPSSPFTVTVRFHPPVEPVLPVPPLGVFGSGTQLVGSTYAFGQASAGGTFSVQAGTASAITATGSLGVTGSGSLTLQNLNGQALALTGGAGDNLFTLDNWGGTVSIDGKTGTDRLSLPSPFGGTITALDPLTITGSVTNKATTSPAILGGSLVLAADTVFNVAQGRTTQNLILGGSVTGPGRLLKQGAGTLVVTGTAAVPVVLGGGTLAGTGTVGTLTNTAGVASTFSPGLPGLTGRLTVNGDLVLGPDVTLVEQLNGTSPGSSTNGFDLLNVLGNVTLNSPVLQPSLGFTSAVGDSFLFLNNASKNAVSGTFAGLPAGAIFLLNNLKFQISYAGGTGNDLVLTHLDTSALFPNRTVTPLVTEGSVATLRGDIVDPDPLDVFILSVDWGDGSPVEVHTYAPSTPSATLTHLYPDDRANGKPYPVKLEWHDQHGQGNSDVLSVLVSNAPPAVAIAGPSVGVREQDLAFTLTATDPSPVDQDAGFRYEVDWGDGSRATKVKRSAGNGSGVSLDHVYTQAGTFTVRVTATDKDGGTAVATYTVTVSAAALEDDPLHPGTQMLAVGGTDGDDVIRLSAAGGGVGVWIGGVSQGTFAPTGRVVVLAGPGDDLVTVDPDVTAPAWLYGGAGNDRLQAGGGNSILLGGDGDDVLTGGGARGVLIGGDGADTLRSGAGDDIVIGGTTQFDADEAALAAVLAEWASARDYATRVANLSGTGTGPRLNGNTFLTADGAAATVFDDRDRDVLTGSPGADWFFASLGRGRGDDVLGG